MFHSHPKAKLPMAIAAALALSLASGSVFAADPPNASNNSSDSASPQNWNSESPQIANWDNMSQQAKDTFRTGELWATYVVNPALQAYKIQADVNGHTATLSGRVETKPEKMLAGHIAQTVRGISTVKNNIKVDKSHVVVATLVPVHVFAKNVGNATTSAEVMSRLLWNEYTDGLDINVKTHGGTVILTGVADTPKAKKRAGKIAAHTAGVTSVDNKLTVNGVTTENSGAAAATDEWITNRLQASYAYTANLDPHTIHIDVNQDDMVTLSGKVDNHMERRLAIDIAQTTRSVAGVKAGGLQVANSSMMSG